MAEITATLVRQLREETNLPMMDCKAALTEAAVRVEARSRFRRVARSRRTTSGWGF